jgi:hypothetical protein
MALTRFRVRSPERDRETDAERFRRLGRCIGDLRAEMERERDGLRDRYEKVTADAAFSQQALEDDGAGAAVSAKIDDMTEAMIRYTKRIASLEAQIGFVTELGRKVEQFSPGNAGG